MFCSADNVCIFFTQSNVLHNFCQDIVAIYLCENFGEWVVTARKLVVCSELIRQKVTEAREVLMREFEDERSHHQKMMSDYTRLQQRFENLQGDLQLMTSPSSNMAPDNSPFACQQLVPINDIADSVSEMSDAGGDTVSLDGTQTVSTQQWLLSFITQIIS